MLGADNTSGRLAWPPQPPRSSRLLVSHGSGPCVGGPNTGSGRFSFRLKRRPITRNLPVRGADYLL
jgi:hypothetical protein